MIIHIALLLETSVQCKSINYFATKKRKLNGGMTSGDSEPQWCFSQIKGTLDESNVTDADFLTTVEFNEDGELLATGDKGGRIVIFQRDQTNCSNFSNRGYDYNVYSTFQSHEPQFDYLKSVEIEEKINKIKWIKRKNPSHFLLTTNDKTIKLWKVSERDKKFEGFNVKDENGETKKKSAPLSKIVIPSVKQVDLMIEASPKRIFANAHTYHINSISINSDQETFISADDLRINLWSLEVHNEVFNIVDLKPDNMEDLSEVITSAEFHPFSCNVFTYTSSKGFIRLCDMRERSLCDQHSKLFEEVENSSSKGYFSEILSSITDVKFSPNGMFISSRDYLTVKIWDVRKETVPLHTFNVHDYLRSKLCMLYENDLVFDKFECSWNGDSTSLMTGSYSNFFRIFNLNSKSDFIYEASKECIKPKSLLKPKKVVLSNASKTRKKEEVFIDSLDFNKKILHSVWHPLENIIAITASNNLYIYHDKQ